MSDCTKRRGTFASVVALTSALLIVPALAQTTPSAPPAAPRATTPAPSESPTPARPTSRHLSAVEAHIKRLHAQLHITAAQEPQWERVATAMRENAKTIDRLVRERDAKLSTMTAVENLNTYAEIADAHAEGLKTLVSAFDDLYQSMSPTQKRNADAIFRSIAEHYAHRAASKAKPATPAPK